MLGERFGRLAVEGGFGEGGERFEGSGVEVQECGSRARVCREACEAGGGSGLEVPRCGGEETECAAHCGLVVGVNGLGCAGLKVRLG